MAIYRQLILYSLTRELLSVVMKTGFIVITLILSISIVLSLATTRQSKASPDGSRFKF